MFNLNHQKMKKLVLTLAIVFAGIMSANAQGLWIGGGVGAQVEKGFTAVELAPEVGYMINDQFTVALGADYTLLHTSYGNASALFLEPYLRYVGGTIGKKFSLFVDLCGDFGLVDADGFAVLLRPGIAWQATDNFTAAFRLGYVGYDHGFLENMSAGGISSDNGFVMNCDLAAPQIRLYYNF